MISFLPLNDSEKVKEYLLKSNLTDIENAKCSVAYDNGKETGYCIYSVDNTNMTVYDVNPKNDILVADGIFRSALFAGANIGVFNAFYDNRIKELVQKLGFISDEKNNSVNFEKLFNSCKH